MYYYHIISKFNFFGLIIGLWNKNGNRSFWSSLGYTLSPGLSISMDRLFRIIN